MRVFSKTSLFAGVAILVGGVLLAGCDDHITVDRDPSVAIRKGMTWAWRPMAAKASQATRQGQRPVISRDVIPGEDYPAPVANPNSQIVRDRLKIAFEQVLASKRLAQVNDPGQADFIVDYSVGIRERRARIATPTYAPILVCGYYGCWQSWGPGYWGPPEIRTIRYHEGTLVFSLHRREDRRLAFRAISQKVVTPETYQPHQVYEGVKHLLKDLKPAK